MGGTTDLSIQQKFDKLSVPVKLLTAGSAACFADFASFPLDTAKVRLQVQVKSVAIPVTVVTPGAPGIAAIPSAAPAGGLHYKGIVGTIGTIAKEEGVRGLYKGLNAGLQRQFCFASVRLGMYETVKQFYQDLLKVDEKSKGGALDITARIFAGLTTGGMAVCLAQPTDVVKIRFQAEARGAAPRYTGTWMAYKTIFRVEGLGGLWKGTLPNIGRNAIINVAEIVCYDIVKDTIMRHGIMGDTIYNHFTSAVIAGFCATVCASPIDVVKTRYMNSEKGKYSGAIDCAIRTMKSEGSSAFYKGFWPSFSRLVSWNILMWVGYEQLKKQIVNKVGNEN